MASQDSKPLSGKVALVTGSSRGIGAAIVRRLAADGANVIVNYVNSAKAAEEIVAELNGQRQGSAVAIKADISSSEQGKMLLEETTKAFGRIDLLILNAGIMQMKTLKDITEEDYDLHFNTNVKGPLFLAKAAAPLLSEGSRIVFFSSSLNQASFVPPTSLLYSASKGAIEQITRILAKDLGPRNITVNCVAPGPIDTDLFRQGKSDEMIAFFTNMHPQKRLGQPNEIANAVAFLSSADSSWVNGQTIMINGGYVV